jgi:hypothetical protein
MQNDLTAGDKIQYRLHDAKGKEHWFDGVIHGVRRYETSEGLITKTTYMVDTGRNTRVDKIVFDHRDREIHKRVAIEQGRGATPDQAFNKVSKMLDLPDNKMGIEEVRQPEQIELPAEFIRLPQ